jgi:transposase
MKVRDLEPKNETIEQEIERLKKAIVERDSKIEELTCERDATIEKLIAERDATIQKLINEVIALRRRLFGRSSERFIPEDPSQLSLAFDGQESLLEELEIQAQEIEVSYTRKKENKQQPVRNAIPEHIRREEIVIEPENIPEGSVRIGEEVTEKLEYVPGEVYVKRTIRPKYALPQGGGIKIADLPSQVLPRSNAGASLLAYFLISKYMDHLPFYRIIEIFKRQKIILAASTVNGWFADSVDLLRILYETLKKEVLSSDYIQIDESTIPVMDKDHPGSTRKGYHWIVRSPIQNQLFFHYQNGSRAQKVVVELLHPFQGAVQSDAYGAYDIYENKKGVLLLGCMAHGRSYQYL